MITCNGLHRGFEQVYWSGIRLLFFFRNRWPTHGAALHHAFVASWLMSVKCNPQHRQWGCRIESMQLDLFAKPTSTFFLICSGSDGQTVKSDKNNETSHIRHNFEGLIINTPANICNIQTSFCYLDPFFQPSNTFF